jgi:hypothetical protein
MMIFCILLFAVLKNFYLQILYVHCAVSTFNIIKGFSISDVSEETDEKLTESKECWVLIDKGEDRLMIKYHY